MASGCWARFRTSPARRPQTSRVAWAEAGREGRAAAGARSKVNALGHLFGAKEELLDLLEPVLRVAKPTKKVMRCSRSAPRWRAARPQPTAYPRRQVNFLLATDTSWSSRHAGRTECADLDWARLRGCDAPYTSRYAYTNFIDRTQGDWARAYYGENLDQLIRVKRRYDRDDFFSFGQGVPV